MQHFIKEILIPYVTASRESLGQSQDQKALAIFDVFAAHRDMLTDINILYVCVPARCTSELQPLDKSINYPYKKKLKQTFIDWYASEVKKTLDKDEEVKINLQTSIIKELHAHWMIKAQIKLQKRKKD